MVKLRRHDKSSFEISWSVLSHSLVFIRSHRWKNSLYIISGYTAISHTSSDWLGMPSLVSVTAEKYEKLSNTIQLLLEHYHPKCYHFVANSSRSTPVMVQVYGVLNGYLKGDSRKNELWLARHMEFFLKSIATNVSLCRDFTLFHGVTLPSEQCFTDDLDLRVQLARKLLACWQSWFVTIVESLTALMRSKSAISLISLCRKWYSFKFGNKGIFHWSK